MLPHLLRSLLLLATVTAALAAATLPSRQLSATPPVLTQPQCPRQAPPPLTAQEKEQLIAVLRAGLRRNLPLVPRMYRTINGVVQPPPTLQSVGMTSRPRSVVRLDFFGTLLGKTPDLDTCQHPLDTRSGFPVRVSVRAWLHPHYANTFTVELGGGAETSAVAWSTRQAVAGKWVWEQKFSKHWQNYQVGRHSGKWLVQVPYK